MFQRFLLCSGLAALVNLIVGYFLYGILGFDHGIGFALSVAAAFISGMGVSFVLNRRFTYATSGRPKKFEMRDFLGVSVVGLGLTTGLAYTLDVTAHKPLEEVSSALPGAILPETLAHIAAVGLTAIYSFFAHKLISFRPASPGVRSSQRLN